MIPDDPLIRYAMKHGHSPWETDRTPICPICGAECVYVFKDTDGNIVGCDECLEKCDAGEEEKCFTEGE